MPLLRSRALSTVSFGSCEGPCRLSTRGSRSLGSSWEQAVKPPAVNGASNGGPGEIGTISTTHTPPTFNWSTAGWLQYLMLLCWTRWARWTRWTQGAMEQDQGWLAELQVRPRVVALLRILSPSSQISITLVTLRPLHLDQQVLTFCSRAPPPCLLRASCPACSTEASHSRTSLDPLSLSPHQLPTISSYHEAAVASCTRSRWLAQLHWKLPRLAPPALSARSPERRTLPAHRLPREAPTSHRSPSRLPHLCSPRLSCRLFSISPTFVTKLEFGQYLSRTCHQWT